MSRLSSSTGWSRSPWRTPVRGSPPKTMSGSSRSSSRLEGPRPEAGRAPGWDLRSRGSSSSCTGDDCGLRANGEPGAPSDSSSPWNSRGDGAMAGELILIVDDNEMNMKLARDVLGFAGFRILEAVNAEEAIVLAHEHVPDVILMD